MDKLTRQGKVTVVIPTRDGGKMPVAVYDEKSVLRKRGVTGETLDLAPGRYVITSNTPDGKVWSSDNFVAVPESESVEVVLSEDPDASPPQAPPANSELQVDDSEEPSAVETIRSKGIDPRDRDFADSVNPVGTFSICKGNWLDHWRKDGKGQRPSEILHRSPPIRRGEITSHTLRGNHGEDVLIECADSEQDNTAIYFAVPFDFDINDKKISRPSICRVECDGRRARLVLDFRSRDVDDLLGLITVGTAEDARAVSAQLIDRAEGMLIDKETSPLLATLGAYVLLRANQLDYLERWTQRLLAIAGDVIPDIAVIYAETLARSNRHEEAVTVLRTATRAPWFRSGIGYLIQRLELYTRVSRASGKSSIEVPETVVAEFEDTLAALMKISWSLEYTATCQYRNLPRLETSAATRPS